MIFLLLELLAVLVPFVRQLAATAGSIRHAVDGEVIDSVQDDRIFAGLDLTRVHLFIHNELKTSLVLHPVEYTAVVMHIAAHQVMTGFVGRHHRRLEPSGELRRSGIFQQRVHRHEIRTVMLEQDDLIMVIAVTYPTLLGHDRIDMRLEQGLVVVAEDTVVRVVERTRQQVL